MARARMRITHWNQRQLVALLDSAMGQRMETAAGLVSREAKLLAGKGGGKPHVPSRPGEPPRRDTGALVRSIRHNVVVEHHVVRGFVSANTAYARALELGYAPNNLAPRPYLRPALARKRMEVFRILVGNRTGHLTLSEIRRITEGGAVAAGLEGAA